MPEGALPYINSKQVNEATNRLLSFMGDVKDGNLRGILANLQTMCEYQAEKLRIYEEHLAELTGKGRPELSDPDMPDAFPELKMPGETSISSLRVPCRPPVVRIYRKT